MGPRHSQARGNVAKDPVDDKFTNDDNDTATQTQPRDVFDSSKYDAMHDKNKGSRTEAKEVRASSLGERTTNSLKPEQTNNEEIARTTTSGPTTAIATTSSSTPDQWVAIQKITPMMVEEKTRTIREARDDEKMPASLSDVLYTFVIISYI